MKSARGSVWHRIGCSSGWALAGLAVWSLPAAADPGWESRPGPGFGDPSGILAELRAPAERFGLAEPTGELALMRQDVDTASEVPRGKEPPSPILAGFLSALVPGTGQLLQGDQRGWLYLGLEATAWFTYLSLHDAGSQAEEDYREFGDAYWQLARYDSVSTCGDGLGPVNFEEEREALLDHQENAPAQYYQDIADDDVYACGWETLELRASYRGMIDDSDALYSAAKWVVGAMVLNHVVSAIDAAKSASGKRKTWMQSLQVAPTRDGLRVELARSF